MRLFGKGGGLVGAPVSDLLLSDLVVELNA